MDSFFLNVLELGAKKNPEGIAIDSSAGGISYKDLLNLVKRLKLDISRSLAFSKDDYSNNNFCAALISKNTVLTYACYIAVNSLGLTLVPISLKHPKSRIEKMLGQLNVSVVFSDGEIELGLSPTIKFLNIKHFELAGPLAMLGSRLGFNPAYILFTSGSTGTPKGVPITESNLDAYVNNFIQDLDIGIDDRFSQTFELTFDLSVLGMLASWYHGATLVLPDPWDLISPLEYISEKRITHWLSVPSVISIAIQTAQATGRATGLRWSYFCGEPLYLQQAKEWLDLVGNSRVMNIYGPTEATITCSFYKLPSDVELWPVTSNGTVPIGILNSGVESSIDIDAIDGSGFLKIKGKQRFSGYVHDLLAGRTYEDKSWYDTGDRVKYEGHELVCLGRVDDQVKINGFRVELAEVKSAFLAHPNVHDVAVVYLRKDSGLSALEALVISRGDDYTEDSLRTHLGNSIPSYMIPEKIVLVMALPRNSNGKIDFRAACHILQEAH